MTEKQEKCSEAEEKEIRELRKRKKRLMKYIELGYLSEEGKKYFKSELLKDINRCERKYRNEQT